MDKLTLYAELFARWVLTLIAFPFAVVFFIFYSLGFLAEYFFTWLTAFNAKTRSLITSLDQTKQNEPKAKTI